MIGIPTLLGERCLLRGVFGIRGKTVSLECPDLSYPLSAVFYNINPVCTSDEPQEDSEELNPFSFKEFIRSKNQPFGSAQPVEVNY